MTDLSDDGGVMVGSGPEWDGVRYLRSEAGGKMDLSLVGQSVIPKALSAGGSLVIGYTQPDGQALGGFARTPAAGMRELRSVLDVDFGLADQLAGWGGLYASAMTDDGRDWAGSVSHNGLVEGWLLDRGADLQPIVEIETTPGPIPPVPEPATYGIVAAFALLGLIGRRRRRSFGHLG